jgi:L-2-hydroxyglutarate oxidase LhgO
VPYAHILPEKITLDQSGANTATIEALVEETDQKIEIRQNKYLNNLVEQDHRAVKVSIENLEQPCVVAANLIHMVDWRERKVKLAARAEPGVMTEVLLRIVPLIGADAVIAAIIEKENESGLSQE